MSAELLKLFGNYTDEAVARESASENASNVYLKALKTGTSVLRVLPPAPGRDSPFLKVDQHYLDIPGVERAVVFNCPRFMEKRPCPVCARWEKLKASASKADQEAAKAYRARSRYFANVIDREHPELGPRIWGFGKQIYDRLRLLRENESLYGLDYTHPLQGRDILVTRRGTGMLTEYDVDLAQRDTPLAKSSAQISEWASQLHDLTALAKVLSWDEIVEKLQVGPSTDAPDTTKALSGSSTEDSYESHADLDF